jgi:integrase
MSTCTINDVDTNKLTIRSAGHLYKDYKLSTGQHRSPRSFVPTESAISYWVKHVGDLSVKRTTKKHVVKFRSALNGLSQNTRANHFGSLSAMFGFLEKEDIIRTNPFAGQERIRHLTPDTHKPYCTKEQRDLLIRTATEPLKCVLMLGFHTGMRYNEIVEARWSWIAWHEGYAILSIRSTETFHRKSRTKQAMRLSQGLYNYLLPLRGPQNAFIVKPDCKHGSSRYRYESSKQIKAHAQKCGVPDFSPHWMRHTFVTQKFNAGVSMDKIARYIGDTIKQVEETYSHLIPENDDGVDADW